MGVLIVDDSMFMRSLITKIFNKHGINILAEAANGKEAIVKYKELKPDVVTMDLMMNEMSGLEAIKEIMKIDPKAEIIVCSSMGQKAFIKEAIELGARGFVIKPFDEDALIDEVEKAILHKKVDNT
ncbi:response regulator [Clostridium sp. P21]|uniref:Stage 0 sporulation protein A homolog n=1 Tax=Clostridium muellerianum TaxID=2716538 RepID=A0A7Y0HPS4_9CLOT|nr:response regulator [Clostridium muellerianum]NMM63003.1 response regulator [Clostridium muellerianum]